MSSLHLDSISFAYNNSDKNIIANLTSSLQQEWTGLVGANGCGKSTLLKILAGQISPNSGSIHGKFSSYYCAQESFIAPNDFANFLSAHDQEASRIKNALELHDLQNRAWSQLSCGEQKRFQLGCALWHKPELLLIDEPTNHLDQRNRNYITQALLAYSGIGVLVSHDRSLLEALCTKHLFFIGEKIMEVSGHFGDAKSLLDQTLSANEKQRENTKKKVSALQNESQRLSLINQAAKHRLSKSKINPKDRDSKAKIDLAKLTGKDGSLGQKKRNIDNRIENLNQKIREIDILKDYSGSIHFDYPNAKHSKVILFQEAGEIFLANSSEKLYFPELALESGEKVAIVGANGIGKTSLIQTMSQSGWLKTKNYFYLKQEFESTELESLRGKLKDLDPESYSRCLQIVARLGSDAKQIFKSSSWSAGEARKFAIALSIVNKVDLLILDEPTNHLDLPSIEKLEEALSSSPLTLLIVSHDRNFIEKVCSRIWKIARSHIHSKTILTEESFENQAGA